MKKIAILIITLLIFSCKKDNKSITVKSTIQDKEEIKDPITPVADSVKLFLDFYSGISFEEYLKTAKDLSQKNILEERSVIDYYYNYKSDCKIQIKPEFVNDQLVKIILYDADCIYKEYEEKYNLSPLIEESSVDYVWLENNPKYSPKFSYQSNGVTIALPDAFRDKTKSLPPAKTVKLDIPNNQWKRRYLINNPPLVVEKGKAVIMLNHELYSGLDDGVFCSYSLNDSKEILAYKMTSKGEEGLGPFGKENEFLVTNSVLRRCEKSTYSRIDITYLSKSYYHKIQSELKKEQEAKDNKRRLEIQKQDERLNSVKDEI